MRRLINNKRPFGVGVVCGMGNRVMAEKNTRREKHGAEGLAERAGLWRLWTHEM